MADCLGVVGFGGAEDDWGSLVDPLEDSGVGGEFEADFRLEGAFDFVAVDAGFAVRPVEEEAEAFLGEVELFKGVDGEADVLDGWDVDAAEEE